MEWLLQVIIASSIIGIISHFIFRRAEKDRKLDRLAWERYENARSPEEKRYWKLTAKHRKMELKDYEDDEAYEELKFIAGFDVFNSTLQKMYQRYLERVDNYREQSVYPKRQEEAAQAEAVSQAASAEIAGARTEKALTRSLTTLAETTRALKPGEDHSEIVNMIDAELRIIDRECPEPITDETARVTLSFLRKRLDECAVHDPVLDLHLSRLLQRIPTEASSSPRLT